MNDSCDCFFDRNKIPISNKNVDLTYWIQPPYVLDRNGIQYIRFLGKIKEQAIAGKFCQ